MLQFWRTYLIIGIVLAILETLILALGFIFKKTKLEGKGFGRYVELFLKNFAVTVWMWPLVIIGFYRV